MKRNKMKRIALAAALATTMLASTPEFGFAQTASDIIATLSSQVQAYDFAAARATIGELQQLGVGAITIGSETIQLEDLLAMIEAAEAGRMEPTALASYLDALATNSAQALFVPAQDPLTVPAYERSGNNDSNFPTGSQG